jgi:hypothetical protein
MRLNAVKVTLDPKGRNVVLDKAQNQPAGDPALGDDDAIAADEIG